MYSEREETDDRSRVREINVPNVPNSTKSCSLHHDFLAQPASQKLANQAIPQSSFSANVGSVLIGGRNLARSAELVEKFVFFPLFPLFPF